MRIISFGVLHILFLIAFLLVILRFFLMTFVVNIIDAMDVNLNESNHEKSLI